MVEMSDWEEIARLRRRREIDPTDKQIQQGESRGYTDANAPE